MSIRNNMTVDPIAFGERVRLARERLKLSQLKLAELVGKDQRTISQVENGHRLLSVADLPKFAEALEVPIAYFYGEELGTHDLDVELLKLFHDLPDDVARHHAIEILRAFLDAANHLRW